MHDFQYKKNELHAEDVPVREIVEKFGTPLYIYSYATLVRHYKAFESAFGDTPHTICFALKANSSAAILKTLAKQGCGADVVSGGELFLALKAGIPANKIVYAGVGKTAEEIRYALRSGILMFNIESADELISVNRIAGESGIKAPIAFRVNPNINASTHPYISTGLKKHKFGIPMEQAVKNYKLARRMPNIQIVGIHCHIGSQITKISPFVDAVKKVLLLAKKLTSHGINIKHLDIGGGLGITYSSEVSPHPADMAKKIIPVVDNGRFDLILEPGRAIAGNAGILVTKVLYLKKSPNKEFVIVDAGMNDLIRPSLYEAYHHILPARKNRRAEITADVVGPICESGDFIARGRKLNAPARGDLLAVMSAGAYGYSMSSNYNGRLRPAEILVKGRKYFIIRERENFGDLVRGEKIPGFLK